MSSEDVLGKAYDSRLIRRLAVYVRPYRALVALSLSLLFATTAVQLAQPYLLKIAIDHSIAALRTEGFLLPVALYLVSLVAEFFLSWGQMLSLERTGQNVVLDLRLAVFSHVQRLPAAFFDRTPVGRLMTRLTSDIEALNEAFASGLVLLLSDLVKLIGIAVILVWMDWRLAAVTLALLPVMLGVSWSVRLRVRDSYREVRTHVARLNAYLQETVTGMRLIQLFSRERADFEEFRGLNRGHRDAQMRGMFWESVFSAVAELIGSIALAAIVWAGGARHLGGAVTFGTLVAFFEYAGRFFRPVQELAQRYTVMQAAMASSERVFALLDTPTGPVAAPASSRVQRRVRGEIAFENVTFGYLPGVTVLHDVSFRVRAGERLAVVGWTGSGKSTVIRLLVRLYEPDSGRITLDGIDIRDYDVGELRRCVGVVLQDHFLFAGTVAGNLSLGDPAIGPERVRAAAAAVGADTFLDKLPDGFATEVRERGANFSVGEKQLLSFARAVAFDPAVLVLDEATSSVDPESERKIQAALETTLRGRTSIVIAHRLATVRSADRILVLHRGSVREEGTHDELLRLTGGIYRTLHELQEAGMGAP